MSSYRDRMQAGVYNQAKPTKASLDKAEAAAAERANTGTTTTDLAGLGAAQQPADEPNATAGALEAAAETGVDVTTIQGTGKDGRVTKADVEAAHQPSDQ